MSKIHHPAPHLNALLATLDTCPSHKINAIFAKFFALDHIHSWAPGSDLREKLEGLIQEGSVERLLDATWFYRGLVNSRLRTSEYVGTFLLYVADALSPNERDLVYRFVIGTGAIGEELFLQRAWLRDVYEALVQMDVSFRLGGGSLPGIPRNNSGPDVSAEDIAQYLAKISNIETSSHVSDLYLCVRACLAKEKVSEEAFNNMFDVFIDISRSIFHDKYILPMKPYVPLKDNKYLSDPYLKRLRRCEMSRLGSIDYSDTDFWYWFYLENASADLEIRLESDEFRAAIGDFVADRDMERWKELFPTSFGKFSMADLMSCKHANDGNHPGRCGLPYDFTGLPHMGRTDSSV